MAVIYDYKLDVFIAFQKHTHEKKLPILKSTNLFYELSQAPQPLK